MREDPLETLQAIPGKPCAGHSLRVHQSSRLECLFAERFIHRRNSVTVSQETSLQPLRLRVPSTLCRITTNGQLAFSPDLSRRKPSEAEAVTAATQAAPRLRARASLPSERLRGFFIGDMEHSGRCHPPFRYGRTPASGGSGPRPPATIRRPAIFGQTGHPRLRPQRKSAAFPKD